MVMEYMQQAMGNGDISSSPIFQKAFDWLFHHAVVIGDNVMEEEYDGLPVTTYSPHLAPPFNLSKYTLLHDFMNNESVLLTEPDEYGAPDAVKQVRYSYSEALADQIAHITHLWVKSLEGLSGGEAESLRQLSQFITAGILTELFKLPLKDGVFETELVKRCTTPALESRFQETFGTRRAMHWFPKSSQRGKWLEDDLGM